MKKTNFLYVLFFSFQNREKWVFEMSSAPSPPSPSPMGRCGAPLKPRAEKRKREDETEEEGEKHKLLRANVERSECLEEKAIVRDRCGRCDKKLTLVQQAQECKCKRFYCAKHRFGVRKEFYKEGQSDGHACSFDYGAEQSKSLLQIMGKVASHHGNYERI